MSRLPLLPHQPRVQNIPQGVATADRIDVDATPARIAGRYDEPRRFALISYIHKNALDALFTIWLVIPERYDVPQQRGAIDAPAFIRNEYGPAVRLPGGLFLGSMRTSIF